MKVTFSPKLFILVPSLGLPGVPYAVFSTTPPSMSDATRREIASVFPAPAQAITWR